MGTDMINGWRISAFNGALLAAYFITCWSIIAWGIMMSPIHGLFERPNISLALFMSDHLQLHPMTMVRFTWLLALGRLTVVAFFAIFLVLIARPSSRNRGGSEEALAIAIGIGSVISFASMIMASQVGEIEALRLHATELLMLLGTGIVMLVETPARHESVSESAAAELALSNPAVERAA